MLNAKWTDNEIQDNIKSVGKQVGRDDYVIVNERECLQQYWQVGRAIYTVTYDELWLASIRVDV